MSIGDSVHCFKGKCSTDSGASPILHLNPRGVSPIFVRGRKKMSRLVVNKSLQKSEALYNPSVLCGVSFQRLDQHPLLGVVCSYLVPFHLVLPLTKRL